MTTRMARSIYGDVARRDTPAVGAAPHRFAARTGVGVGDVRGHTGRGGAH